MINCLDLMLLILTNKFIRLNFIIFKDPLIIKLSLVISGLCGGVIAHLSR